MEQKELSLTELDEKIKIIYNRRLKIERLINAFTLEKHKCNRQISAYLKAKFSTERQEPALPLSEQTGLEIPSDPKELTNKINSLKRYIRRYKKKMVDFPDRPLYSQLYVNYRAEYKALTGDEYDEKL